MELFQNFAYFTGNIAYEVWEKRLLPSWIVKTEKAGPNAQYFFD